MDVICERCSTAYEFDDALVSERGTTVKCTNCGHQFKIRKASGGSSAPECWVVRTVDGRVLEFGALRELQSAIDHAHITREDVLSRGATRPRRLGSIAELEPFFAKASTHLASVGTSPGLGHRHRTPTPQGLGTLAPQRHEASVAIPLPVGPKAPASEDETLVRRRPASVPPPPRRPASIPPAPQTADSFGMGPLPGVIVAPRDAPPLPEGSVARAFQARAYAETVVNAAVAKTLPVPVDSPFYEGTRSEAMAPPPPNPPTQRANGELPQARPDTFPREQQVVRGTANYGTPREARISEARSGDGRISDAARSSDSRYSEVLHGPPPALTPTPANVRPSFSNEEYVEPRFSSMEPPKRSGAGRWIVGVVAAGIVVLGAVTVGRRVLVSSATAPSAQVSDARINTLLAEGEKSFREGDLDGAQEPFNKASALAEKDAKVAIALARLAVVRGDVAWLRTKLLASDDPDFAGAQKLLASAAERARKAADRAAELAPEDPVATRLRIDALRMGNNLPDARKLVDKLPASTREQPDSAVTLAALDLGEEKPEWATVISRLKKSLDGEGNIGRARSMLTYALAKSGDGAGAQAELDALKALSRPHPLTQPLRAFLAKNGTPVDVSALPDVGSEIPADWKEALKQGVAAKGKGDKKRAEQLLQAAVTKSQDDPEAVVALGDLKWETGDKPGALAAYKKVLEKTNKSSPYYKHAKERIEGDGKAPEPSGDAPRRRSRSGDDGRVPDDYVFPGSDSEQAKPPPAPPPQDAPAPPPPAPPADTSDLPGIK